MNRYSVWRYMFIVVLMVLAVIYALPNLYGSDPAIQVSPKNAAYLKAEVSQKIKHAFVEQHLPYISIKRSGNALQIRFQDTTTQLKAQDVLKAILGDSFSIAPNLAPLTPKWLLDLGAHQMRKGLDLQGGIHFLLAVDTKALITQRQMADQHAIALALRQENIRYSGLVNLGSLGIRIDFHNPQSLSKALSALRLRFSDYLWEIHHQKFQSFIQGVLSHKAWVNMQHYAVLQNMAILRKRINALGVSEPVVVQQGAANISVDLPGIQDSARAKEMMGKVATIQLQLEDVEHDARRALETGDVPLGSQLYYYQNQPVLLKNPVILHGRSIVSANAQIGERGRPVVAIRLGGNGQTLFNRITAKNIGKPLAVVLTEMRMEHHMVHGKVVKTARQVDRVINIATINSALGNYFVIEGLSSMQYARNLALLLRSGAYSAPVHFVQERLVGPSLGKANIAKGKLSTLMGTLLVVIFMALYYRVFGLIADLALILNLVFIVAILSIIGATLTLPGIAAIVLTLGMAVDANVLINERIREELRLGMTPQAAIHAGYARAFMTIVDANVTTLIVAVVLVSISSSSVKGFAVNLIIGLLTSMLTSIFFTRALVNGIYGYRAQLKKISIGISTTHIKQSKN